jgi:beta-alanine degradation protein BauB
MGRKKIDDVDALKRGLLAALPALMAAEAAKAQDAARVRPGSYKVVLENASVRVLEYNSRPNMGVCGVGLHSHPAHLAVCLTPGIARVKVGKRVVTEANAQGDVFWEEAVTHEAENVSGRAMRTLLVELKAPRR